MKIIYTPEAISDLKRLRDFIEQNNPMAAQAVAKRLLTGINNLKTFSRMGIEVSKAPNPDLIRDLILDNYTTRYLINDKQSQIHILRVWHHKEDDL